MTGGSSSNCLLHLAFLVARFSDVRDHKPFPHSRGFHQGCCLPLAEYPAGFFGAWWETRQYEGHNSLPMFDDKKDRYCLCAKCPPQCYRADRTMSSVYCGRLVSGRPQKAIRCATALKIPTLETEAIVCQRGCARYGWCSSCR